MKHHGIVASVPKSNPFRRARRRANRRASRRSISPPGRFVKTRRMGLWPVFLVIGVTLVWGAAGALSWAADRDGQEIPFAAAHLFFELNNTDGDLGIHALIDGEPWQKLVIKDPNEHRILLVGVQARLQRQGLTEIFFESAEPPFDELAPAEFFRRFPAGTYEIEGKTLDGKDLESEVELTHIMPAPPEPTVNGMPMAVQCDEEEPGYDATMVEAGDTVTIAWPHVARSHPNPDGGGAGVLPPVDVEIHNYEVVIEAELELHGEAFTSVFSVILPPDVTSITIPAAFLALSDTFKYEVLAREKSYNQTAVESCFWLVE